MELVSCLFAVGVLWIFFSRCLLAICCFVVFSAVCGFFAGVLWVLLACCGCLMCVGFFVALWLFAVVTLCWCVVVHGVVGAFAVIAVKIASIVLTSL